MRALYFEREGLSYTVVGRCRLKPGVTRVESALIPEMGEAPYGSVFYHSGKWGMPPMHHLTLESRM